jgi:hypothetical protein
VTQPLNDSDSAKKAFDLWPWRRPSLSGMGYTKGPIFLTHRGLNEADCVGGEALRTFAVSLPTCLSGGSPFEG